MSGREPTVRTLEPPIPKSLFAYVINPVMKAILRSPIHRLVSDTLLLITYVGRTSGTEFTTPVGYEQLNGTLYITSQTNRVWWKNLRGGAPVTVRLRGQRRRGEASVVEDDEAVADYVRDFIDRHGLNSVNRLALAIEGDDVPSKETLADGLAETVVIAIDLDAE